MGVGNLPLGQKRGVLECRHAQACPKCLCMALQGLGTPALEAAEFYVTALAHKIAGGRGTPEQRPPPGGQASPYPILWFT